MATIYDLPNPKFLSLSPTERFELIRSLRTARRTQLDPREKKTKTAGKTTRKTARKTAIQLTGDLAGLSQEQLSQLMELMNNASTD